MKKKYVISAVLALSVFVQGCGTLDTKSKNPVKPLESFELEEGNEYTCVYDGIKHDLLLYLPEDSKDAPLILMLHGYGETAEAFRNKVHFEERANPEGYAVVYVTGAPDPNDPTSAAGWNSGIREGGNDDVGFLRSLADHLQQEYSLDEDRTFAAGFSNGAFMTHRLAMEAQDTFEGVASVAGKMTESVWEEKNEKNDVSVLQITGEKDNVIPKNSDKSAKYSKDPAIEDVIGYWAESDGLKQYEVSDIGKESVLTKFKDNGKKVQVWSVFVSDGRHSWPEEESTGIDANELILEFFETVGGDD